MFLKHPSRSVKYEFKRPEMTEYLTYNERRSVVARYFGFSAGWENDVDDPEAGGVMKPQQNHCEQRPAHATRGPHLLCRAAAAAPLGAL